MAINGNCKHSLVDKVVIHSGNLPPPQSKVSTVDTIKVEIASCHLVKLTIIVVIILVLMTIIVVIILVIMIIKHVNVQDLKKFMDDYAASRR